MVRPQLGLSLLLAFAAAHASSENAVTFRLSMDGGMGPGIERPPPQQLRVPLALLAPTDYPQAQAGGSIETAGVAIVAEYAGDRFVSAKNVETATHILVGIAAAGYQERARLIDPDVLRPEPTDMGPEAPPLQPRTKGPRLPFGLHELVPPAGGPVYQTIYFGEDTKVGFVTVNCFGLAEQGVRRCRLTAELTTYLVLSIGMDESELPGWREKYLAARALALSLVLK